MRRADLAAFVAVADNLSFRAAASCVGVTPSALSHTMRRFGERLGFRLLNRTTRSDLGSARLPAWRRRQGCSANTKEKFQRCQCVSYDRP